MSSLFWMVLLCVGACVVISGTEGKDFSHLNNNYNDDLRRLLINSSDAVDLDIYTYRERINILRDMIMEECKDVPLNRRRREIVSEVKKTKLEVEKVLYERMIRTLVECRGRKRETTTQPLQPAACQSAINLTESWRRDNQGSGIKPINGGVNCDTNSTDDVWFRFTGDAGNMMLDECPPPNSCGTNAGMWTNATMPTDVGRLVDFAAYVSWSSNCYYSELSMQVMRCSDYVPNDFIYKYTASNGWCNVAFCGMTKLY